jgi:VWFA-related protein
MRHWVIWVAALGLCTVAGHAAQEPSSQTFQTRIDLITIDVAAVDGSGRPVDDLRARDFAVKVDGKARDVVSAELVKVDRSAPDAPLESPAPSLITTNAVTPGGRLIAIGIDQTLIVPGSITPLLGSASRFVDRLTPRDHAALVTFPEPGPRVDFTLDHSSVRAAMNTVVGQPATVIPRTFYPSLTEAIEIHMKERIFLDLVGTPEEIWKTVGPMMRRVLERGTCREMTVDQLLQGTSEVLQQCLRELESEAVERTLHARQEADMSLRRLESFLTELTRIEGPKSMVLISAGLLIEDLSVLNEVARLAAASRTAIHVIAVEPQRETVVVGLAHGQSPMTLQERQLELTGLETVADRTGGSFVRASGGTGDGIFERLSSELSAWYVVAVERRPGDPDRQRVEVEVRRRGVQTRSNRSVVAAAAINRSRPAEELLRDAMSSPIAIPGLPLRVSTFARRDGEGGKQRLHLAAHIGQPGATPGEYAVGYVVIDAQGKVVSSLGRRMPLTSAGANAPLQFETALALAPGRYAIRFGAVSADGRRGTIVRQVDVGTVVRDAFDTSDLVVGAVVPEGEAMRPNPEPHVSDGRVAAYLELYQGQTDPGSVTVTIEIAEGESSPALAAATLNLAAGPEPEWRVASGAIDTDLLPGRYVARATVRRNGDTVKVLARPFVLAPRTNAAARRTGGARGVAISPEMQQRTARYVATVVGSLGNIVAREEFTLSGPDRRVTSDFLLVRYPGSDRDLLMFRDVTHVNGTAVPGRDQQLVDLFVKPISSIRERVREITTASEDHVPPVLSPILGLAFLQADVQRRFEMTVSDAGSDWPAQVKAVAFVETRRPTLLRAGPFGDIDIPSRGTAWIEETTGRVLQTQVQVGTGRSAATMTTRFKVDDRLKVLVPDVMRTQNPSGTATYSSFRRFSVTTASVIK